jgi:D-sedoheptulose 7-phosphate isomerase
MQPTTDARLATVRAHLAGTADVLKLTLGQCAPAILAAADLVAESFRKGGKLMICGNGGSAADCQHLAAEFTSRLTIDFPRPALPALALTTDSSFLTAYANDIDFEGVFARQVEAFGKPEDVLLGISTSGGSKNVVRAVEAARKLNAKTIVLTGNRGRLREMADIAICVPSESTQHIQETHLAIEHLICHFVERALFGQENGSKTESRPAAA